MAFQPVPNTAQVEVIFTSNGSIVENVYHVEKPAPWSQPELQDLNEAFEDWWRINLAGHQPTTMVLQRIDSRDLTAESAPFDSRPCVGACAGTDVSAALPNNATLAVKWTTGLTGRSFRGRTYHIGLGEDKVVGDTVQDAHRLELQTAYNALRTALQQIDPTWVLVVVSRITNGVPRPSGVTTPIVAASVNGTVDSQRRRLLTRGL